MTRSNSISSARVPIGQVPEQRPKRSPSTESEGQRARKKRRPDELPSQQRPAIAQQLTGSLKSRAGSSKSADVDEAESSDKENSVPQLGAEFGAEFETDDGEVHPRVPWKTRLLQRKRYVLETDDAYLTGKSHFEFNVFHSQKQRSIRKAVYGAIGFGERLRTQYRKYEQRLIPINKVSHNAETQSNIRLNNPYIDVTPQFTYGVSLNPEQIRKAIYEANVPKKDVDEIGERTEQVKAYFSEKYGESLSDKATGFIDLINYYLFEADKKTDIACSVKGYFRMMLRSNFCSIYDELLDPKDREHISKLLTTDDAAGTPDFMKVFSYEHDKKVFLEPYPSMDYVDPEDETGKKLKCDLLEGPSIKEWLHSIVHGVPGVKPRRDWMSRLPGTSDTYSLGYYGVDPAGFLLVEMRQGRLTPRRVPLNSCLMDVTMIAFALARKFNPALRPAIPDEKLPTEAEREFVFSKCEAINTLNDVIYKLENKIPIEDVTEHGIQMFEFHELWEKQADGMPAAADKLLQAFMLTANDVAKSGAKDVELLQISRKLLDYLWEVGNAKLYDDDDLNAAELTSSGKSVMPTDFTPGDLAYLDLIYPSKIQDGEEKPGWINGAAPAANAVTKLEIVKVSRSGNQLKSVIFRDPGGSPAIVNKVGAERIPSTLHKTILASRQNAVLRFKPN